MRKKRAQLLTYLYWCMSSIISKELRLGVFNKSCGKHSVQLWSCLKLASKRYYVNLHKLVCVVNNIQEIRFAVLDKTCKKHRVQPCCCSKLASSHSAQLSFCFKLVTFVKKRKIVRNTVCNCRIARNWRQSTAQLSFCFKLATLLNG